jgi:4-hydroxybenzoate polyprenyltransferase
MFSIMLPNLRMTVKTTIIEYAKLSSAHFVFLSAIIPVTGAIAMGEKNLLTLTIIFIIGLSAHIFGFAFNHYNDIEVDGLSKDISKRPLPSGSISKKHALLFILTVFFIGGITTEFFFGTTLLIIYIIGITLAALYDIYSKKISGMDFILAAAVTTGVVFGAATVSFQFSNLLIVLFVLSFIQTLNLNLIAGGIKDADHDAMISSQHISTRLGLQVENNHFIIPSSFKFLGYLFGSIYAFFVLVPVVLGIISLHIIQILILVCINMGFFIITHNMVNLQQFNRQQIRKYIVLQYTINWFNIPILLMSVAPYAVFLMLYPIIGLIFSNIIMYKTILRPQVM